MNPGIGCFEKRACEKQLRKLRGQESKEVCLGRRRPFCTFFFIFFFFAGAFISCFSEQAEEVPAWPACVRVRVRVHVCTRPYLAGLRVGDSFCYRLSRRGSHFPRWSFYGGVSSWLRNLDEVGRTQKNKHRLGRDPLTRSSQIAPTQKTAE